MDFSRKEQFTAKKASGIGVVVLLHAMLAGGLVYGLHTTKLTIEHVIPVTVDPPKPQIEPPVEPRVEPRKLDIQVQPIDRVVIDPVDPTPTGRTDTPTPADPPAKGGNGPGVDGGTIDGNGSKPIVHTSTTVKVDLNACKPPYPTSALKAEQEGTVRLKLEVGANGRLLSASVVQSSGYTALDRAAVSGLAQCEFKAATQDGTPVQSSYITDYVWSIDR